MAEWKGNVHAGKPFSATFAADVANADTTNLLASFAGDEGATDNDSGSVAPAGAATVNLSPSEPGLISVLVEHPAPGGSGTLTTREDGVEEDSEHVTAEVIEWRYTVLPGQA